jgi:hypothetical protein
MTPASANPYSSADDRPHIAYVDNDATEQPEGTLWGSIEIQAGQANAAFMIDIFFEEE